MVSKFHQVALVGDATGIGMLLDTVPRERVACLVAAAIRPQYLETLRVLSQEHNLPLLVQPRRNDKSFAAFLDEMRRMNCDSLICNSYSMLLPEDVLSLVNHAAFNFHAALLPRNRGANPVQWAIIRGETETGISLHQMVAAQDAGPVLRQLVIPIHDDDTWVDVTRRVNDVLPSFVKESVSFADRRQVKAGSADVIRSCEKMLAENGLLNMG